MDEADDLLQRALLEPDDAAAVALSVAGLPMCESLTVIFHGRRDLGTIQTYITHGARGAGAKVSSNELLRVPVDLDLHDAEDRDSAEALYAAQARILRDAIVAADTVLAVWAQPLAEAAGGTVDVHRSVALSVELPAHRLLPIALTVPERHVTVTPVCGARALAEGRPPMGIACAQQDVAHVYPLSDDPEACLEDFMERAADHARATAQRLTEQETSVQRFLELNEDPPPT
ncbi:MAG: hypothetical protein JHC95_20625, partial [Solirubrobacteraceae bacterium]|nr:hypothetical protein [Solirubrobacteraceae bacterium]